MVAQISISDDFCGTPDPEFPDPPGVYSQSIDMGYLHNFEPVYFNIFFWGIAKSDGTWSGSQMTPEKAQNAVTLLNEHFGSFNICFNLLGMDIINSDEYHDGKGLGDLWSFATANDYIKENSFNIYVPNTLNGSTGIASYYNPRVAIRACCVVHPTFVHEIGHSFNLCHTFECQIGYSNLRPHPTNCERATRDINDPDYNASDINGGVARGDKLHDTNAVPNFFREQHNHVAYAVEAADIGYSWTSARNNIAFSPNGFNSFPDAAAIEQALIDYGFTTAEINHLKFNSAIDNAYYDQATKTYTPDARINDPNSPFFKDCKGTPYQINTVDIRNFMAYTHTSSKELFTVGQGIRMHEAINNTHNNTNADLLAAMREHPLDLYIRDHEGDIGQEPNIHTEIFWNSPDIWIRNYADNIQEHQNPSFGTNPNHVYVRVTNKSCVPSTGEETLRLYWSKADTGISHSIWSGTVTGGPNNVPLGGSVGDLNIPVIAPGDEVILRFPWVSPNPEDYVGITENDWHFCLLARIVADNDPMTFPNQAWSASYNNNNALKNVTLVNTATPTIGRRPGGVVSIGNISGDFNQSFNFDFFTNETESPIFEEAEIQIILDNDAFDRWMAGGGQAVNIELLNEEERTLIINGNNAGLRNMLYGPGEWSTLYLSFNFLTEEVSGKDNFEYHLIQRDAVTGEATGGEVYHIIRDPERPLFAAEGNSYKNTAGETEMTAKDIGEQAIYNWYTPEGELLYSGKDFVFIPDLPGDYLLEITAETDGYKDYFNLTIAVNAAQDQILSLSPNPASGTVEVQYQINPNATNALLKVVSFFENTNTTHPVDLNTSGNNLHINLSGYPTGHYAMILQVDGQAVHAKQLIIN